MGDDQDLSVVIPVHDGERHVNRVAEQLLSIPDLSMQVVLVDDCSQDTSGELIAALAADEDRVDAIRLPHQSGAGVARNAGFRVATGRYTLFFDVDDVLHPDTVTHAVRLMDSTEADVAILSYDYQRGLGEERAGMVDHDVEIWDRYVGQSHQVLTTLEHAPKLLEMTNYPWNKVIRSERYRELGLRFGSTPVHNDILGHWLTLLGSANIVLVNRVIATHVVREGERNLTNRRGVSRLTLFDALDETYSYLESRPALRQRYANHYWAFALRTMEWAGRRIHEDWAEEYRLRRREHIQRMDLGDYARMRLRRDPQLADAIVQRSIF